jgi:hypothetical protein
MKRILLALSICLFAPACVDDTAGPAADPAAESAAPADPAAAATDETPVPRELSAVPSCSANCAMRYDECLSRAQDDAISICLCFNARVSCLRACGIPGFPRKC